MSDPKNGPRRRTLAGPSPDRPPNRVVQRLKKGTAISRSYGSIAEGRDSLSRLASTSLEAESVADFFGAQRKIVWTKDFKSEQSILDARFKDDLPKSSELLHEVRVNGITFLSSNLQNVFDKFSQRTEQPSIQEKDLRRICHENVSDLDEAISNFRFNANLEQNQPYAMLPPGMRDIVQAILLWNTVYMRFLDFIRKREMVVGRFTDEFSAIEEENGILKDVLAQSGAGNLPIQIVVKGGGGGMTFRPLKHMVDKETNFPEWDATPRKSAVAPPIVEEEAVQVDPAASAGSTASLNLKAPSAGALHPIIEDPVLEVVERKVEVTDHGCQTDEILKIETKDAAVATVEKTSVVMEAQTDLLSAQIEEYVKRLRVAEEKIAKHEAEGIENANRMQKMQTEVTTLRNTESELQTTIKTITQERDDTEHRLTTLLRESQSTLITQLQLSSRYQTEATESSKQVQTLQSELFTLQTVKTQIEEHDKSQTIELTATLTKLDETKSENIAYALEVQGLKDEIRRLERVYAETKMELNAADIRCGELVKRIEVGEEERGMLEKTVKEAVEGERKMRKEVGEIKKAVGKAQEEIDKLAMYNLDMERLVRMEREKSRELEVSLRAIMRFPDVSLGRDLVFPDLPPSAEADKILQEMINSNNVRIAMLEQKNNEFRVMRLKQSASQKRPAAAPNAPLYDEKLLDRVKDSLLYQDLITHFGAGRGWEHMLPMHPQLRETMGTGGAYHHTWGPQRIHAHGKRPPSPTRHPPDELSAYWVQGGQEDGMGAGVGMGGEGAQYAAAKQAATPNTRPSSGASSSQRSKVSAPSVGKEHKSVHWKGSAGTLTSGAMKKAWQ
ncbi:hypothetical protein HDV00_004811 [Rhizophlyctis rosea]|nr:hypothetical protein HDV00_004811 [Rhizophlyctis rosea]